MLTKHLSFRHDHIARAAVDFVRQLLENTLAQIDFQHSSPVAATSDWPRVRNLNRTTVSAGQHCGLPGVARVLAERHDGHPLRVSGGRWLARAGDGWRRRLMTTWRAPRVGADWQPGGQLGNSENHLKGT